MSGGQETTFGNQFYPSSSIFPFRWPSLHGKHLYLGRHPTEPFCSLFCFFFLAGGWGRAPRYAYDVHLCMLMYESNMCVPSGRSGNSFGCQPSPSTLRQNLFVVLHYGCQANCPQDSRDPLSLLPVSS